MSIFKKIADFTKMLWGKSAEKVSESSENKADGLHKRKKRLLK